MSGRDLLYVTSSEWKESYGGKKSSSNRSNTVPHQRLPLYHCALTLQKIEGEPCCTMDGTVFDKLNIVPFIKQHRVHPVTGEPLRVKDLIPLHFYRNGKGQLHCPVTFKVFNDHSHIVAIKTTGNVYSYDAIQNLCIKLNNWKDLLDDQVTFAKKDIITIQNPHDASSQRDLNQFYHLKHGLTLLKKEQKVSDDSKVANINTSKSMHRVFNEMKEKQTEAAKGNILYKSTPVGSASKSTSFTSSISHYDPSKDTRKEEEEKKKFWLKKFEQYKRIKKKLKKNQQKAYVTLHTSMGDINVELYPYLVPQACDNFLGLCENGYYNGVKFHRLIKGFMIQGGDPTGTGKGGSSLWNENFKDDFHPQLKHDQPGILSMANSGKDTNGSQFFITFQAAPHLDKKHTIFGKVVGGMNILKEMEQVRTDPKTDQPLTPILIERTSVYNNPFKEDEKEQEEKQKAKELEESGGERGEWFSNPVVQTEPAPVNNTSAITGGVGKYIKPDILANNQLDIFELELPKKRKAPSIEPQEQQQKKKPKANQFNFSNW
jgi:peptidyl-prolyl cis-trans isomerase-like protein 2